MRAPSGRCGVTRAKRRARDVWHAVRAHAGAGAPWGGRVRGRDGGGARARARGARTGRRRRRAPPLRSSRPAWRPRCSGSSATAAGTACCPCWASWTPAGPTSYTRASPPAASVLGGARVKRMSAFVWGAMQGPVPSRAPGRARAGTTRAARACSAARRGARQQPSGRRQALPHGPSVARVSVALSRVRTRNVCLVRGPHSSPRLRRARAWRSRSSSSCDHGISRPVLGAPPAGAPEAMCVVPGKSAFWDGRRHAETDVSQRRRGGRRRGERRGERAAGGGPAAGRPAKGDEEGAVLLW
jgi:hypothetical protein